MSGIVGNKLALLAIAVTAVVVVGVVIAISLDTTTTDENSPNHDDTQTIPKDSNSFGDKYGIVLTPDPKDGFVISEDEDHVRIHVKALKWREGQNRETELPNGEPVADLPIQFTTSMGIFMYHNDASFQGETNQDGEETVALIGGEIKGVATVTAEALDGSGVAASIRIYVVDVQLSPGDVIINKNERVSFEVKVQGIDDPDSICYTWKNYVVEVDYKPGNPEPVYSSSGLMYTSPLLELQRKNGRGKDGYIEVEAFLLNQGGPDISLGKAKSDIHLIEYYSDVALVGRVTHSDSGYYVKYGCLIPKIDGAVAYGVRGSGFNDPLYYGDEYGSGLVKISELVEEEDGYFLSFTGGGSTGEAPKSDSELIADMAWRFEGGTFYACPYFDHIE